MEKPVNLQINNSGAWRQLLRFDSSNAPLAGTILYHADALARLTDSRLRITAADGNQTVLQRWSKERSWYTPEDLAKELR